MSTNRVQREAVLRWVPISMMKVSEQAQRTRNQGWVDYLIANFDLEQLGTPTVNKRDGWFYVMDGQHRVEALRGIGWGDQQIQCWEYEGLTEREEANKFLHLNDQLNVSTYEKFQKAVVAGWELETAVNEIVLAEGCMITKANNAVGEGRISAVATLVKIYKRAGGPVLSRTIRLINNTYGSPGLVAPVLDGVALVCARYGNDLDDDAAVAKLSKVVGGVNGLLSKAELIRRQTGQVKNHSVAAAIVETINSGRGGKRMVAWFRESAAAS